jgi:perosamine synthetase
MNDSKLAIDGGKAMIPDGPPRWPRTDERIRTALLAAYADGSWGQYHAGHVETLERRLAEMHGVGAALACCSGTFAVELALRALKISAGDEVALAGYDFAGNFRAVEAIGARPVLVDVEPGSWCLDAASLAHAWRPETKAVIVSHLHGALADMSAIAQFCRERGVAVIEDACQSPGAEVQGRMAGTWGDVGVLSFGGSKLLTAGRGGAILTNDPAASQRAKVFSERGNQAFPLSELQAAVLLPQLDSLAAENAQRLTALQVLLNELRDVPELSTITNANRGSPVYYKLGWRFRSERFTRERFLQAVRAEGVALDAGFRGFAGRSAARCRKESSLEHSRAAAEETVLLHHPVLLESPETLARVALAIRKVRGSSS